MGKSMTDKKNSLNLYLQIVNKELRSGCDLNKVISFYVERIGSSLINVTLKFSSSPDYVISVNNEKELEALITRLKN